MPSHRTPTSRPRQLLFILTYDENDGMFDHVRRPHRRPGRPSIRDPGSAGPVPAGDGLPIGLGFRVPVTLVSPWTLGGNVYSEVLDHTSLIRIIEARFGVMEPNISAWRRQTVGDFTSALNFSRRPSPWPANPAIRLGTANSDLLTAQVRGRLQPDAYRPGRQPAFPAALTGGGGGWPSSALVTSGTTQG